MSEKTFSFTMSQSDYDAFVKAARAKSKNPSQYARELIASNVSGFSGTVGKKGGVRPGAGRPAKPPRRQPQAS